MVSDLSGYGGRIFTQGFGDFLEGVATVEGTLDENAVFKGEMLAVSGYQFTHRLLPPLWILATAKKALISVSIYDMIQTSKQEAFQAVV